MGSPTARCTRMPSAERSCSPSSSMWPTGRYGIESGRCHGRTWWLPGSDIRWPDGSSAGSGRIRVARCGPRWPADRRFTESPRRGRCPARAVSATTPRRRAACLPSRRSRSRSRARAGVRAVLAPAERGWIPVRRRHHRSGRMRSPATARRLRRRRALARHRHLRDTPQGRRTVVRSEDQALLESMTREEFCGRVVQVTGAAFGP